MTTFAADTSFNQAAFDAYAQKYGNKAANLYELQKIIKLLNQQADIKSTFAVPPFLPISHDTIAAYLGNLPLIEKFWNDLKSAKRAGVEATLEILSSSITSKFKKPFLPKDPSVKEALQRFLDNAVKENKLLMVRSTGDEDSKKVVNAGGNESVAGVLPDISALSPAMGKVISSYFSTKSIGQRLAEGDNVFEKKPFLPVLLQFMVGERTGDLASMPVSGVIFSPEAKGFTPGVVRIDTSYGHNEGVVNGLVPVDSFYVKGSTIHPLIAIKPYRLIAHTDGSMRTVLNPSDKIYQPSLKRRQIFDLYKAAQFIQTYYGYPVDIEFVIQNNIIYLVQVRPLKRMPQHPSYIAEAFLETIPKDKQATAYSIGIGDGSVQVIDNIKEQIIEASTANEALDQFLRSDDKDEIKAIIIGEFVRNTSHAATTFRGNRKPLLFASHFSMVQKMIGSISTLLIDPQQGVITTFMPSDEFKAPEDTIKKGWYTHPIVKKTSLFDRFIPKISEEVTILQPKEFYAGVKTTGLIRKIAHGTQEDAIKALRSILARVFSTIYNEQKKQKALAAAGQETNPELIAQLRKVLKHTLSVSFEIYQALKKETGIPEKEQNRLVRLYPIAFLQALLSQVPFKDRFVDDYSLSSLLKVEQAEQQLFATLGLEKHPLREHYVQYAKAIKYALNKELEASWFTFLKQLSTVKENKLQQEFSQLMYFVARLDFLPLWMNVLFPQAIKKEKDPEKTALLLIDEYKKNKSFLEKLNTVHKRIQAIDMPNWKNEDSFEKQFVDFKKNIIDYFTDDTLRLDFEGQTLFGKLAALSVMRSFISTFDTAIKTIIGSGKRTENIISNVQRMVDAYLDVLQAWATFTTFKNQSKKLLKDIDRDEYIGIIRKTIKEAPLEPEQLEPSEQFALHGNLLGSNYVVELGSSYIGKIDGTLEDMFTLIHQNLLIILALFTKEALGTYQIAVPEVMQRIKYQIDKNWPYFEESYKHYNDLQLIGISLSKEGITYYYNFRLPWGHSMDFSIAYNKATDTASLTVHFFDQRYRRLMPAKSLSEFVGLLSNFPVEQPYQYDVALHEYSHAWQVPNRQAIIEDIPHYFWLFIQAFSLQEDAPEFIPYMLDNFIKKKSLDEKKERIKRLKDKEHRWNLMTKFGLSVPSYYFDVLSQIKKEFKEDT